MDMIKRPRRLRGGANIRKMVEWQEAQQNKPQRFIDDIKGKIIWAVLAAVITFILARVGL